MPPKKGKAEAVKAKKAVEDKTFGLKNKNKSAKMQKYVQQVQQQATQNVKSTKKVCLIIINLCEIFILIILFNMMY